MFSQMPLPPYNQLIQNLKDLIKQQPKLIPVLKPVILYLQYTHEEYEDFILNNIDQVDWRQ